MKKIITIAIAGIVFSSYTKSDAQVRFNVGIHVGAPVYVAPAPAPVYYDNDDFYYYPELDMYFDVAARQYVYFDDGRWMYSAGIPSCYRGYDIYHARRVCINEPRPWIHADVYRERYAYGRPVYAGRDRDDRYYNRCYENHYDHDGGWRRGGDDDHDRGRGHGWGRH
ncbi:MAG: hypothetical protein KGO81_10980 [Bacteroidota bacterium]|nr:hypothetical protein [Bacteroidota bacterium]